MYVNTTLGLAGLFDVATGRDLPRQLRLRATLSFGETLRAEKDWKNALSAAGRPELPVTSNSGWIPESSVADWSASPNPC